MRRSSRSTPTDRISLFPFLAVLICTMGALLVLLVVMSQHAQAKASQQHAQQSEAERADTAQELEELQMWVDQYEGMQVSTEQELNRRRAELAHIEDHMRRLREKIDQLKTTREQLSLDDSTEEVRIAELQRQIEQTRVELADATRKLEEQQKIEKKVSYAIIPYEGPNQTRRRPIYLECRSDGVILQPEGIRLEERDFIPPLGPANPLVSAVRAASAHWMRLVAEGHDVGQPYPLLLVRADGIHAYHAARSAMKSWEADFGYELIGNDLELEFPVPDARLAVAAQLAVDASRRRREKRGGGFGGRGGRGGGNSSEESPFGDRRVKTGGLGQRDPNSSTSIEGDRPNDRGRDRPASTPIDARMEGTENRAISSTPPADGSQTANVESIAESRGENWASPGASRGLIPFTRTLTVQVAADRFVIMPQDPSGIPNTVMMSDSTRVGVEEFVSKVWEEMKSWGSAGRGMYWRPELNLQVHPGGEGRARELEILLRDSGLDLGPSPR